MAGDKTDNKLQVYASPLNASRVKDMAARQSTTQSKIVNEALTYYFNDKKP